jgi:hypothetical protein
VSIIISLLVSLLGAFLSELLKEWFAKHPLTGSYGAASQDLVSYVAASKAQYLARVKRRFWLGSKRELWASALFDRAHARMTTHTFMSANGLVAALTGGLDSLTPAELEGGKLAAANEKRFTVMPNGLVQGGSALYSLDPTTGSIAYRAAVKVGKWFLSKTYEASGTYKVDPTLLNPTNLSVGKVLQIGDLQMRVQSLGQSTALVALTVGGALKGSGTAILTTNEPVVALNAIDATVTAYGMSLALSLRPE